MIFFFLMGSQVGIFFPSAREPPKLEGDLQFLLSRSTVVKFFWQWRKISSFAMMFSASSTNSSDRAARN
jgi:hypothetical protein